MLFSGIDLHKRSIAIHTLNADGTVVRAANLPAQRRALTAYFGTRPARTARWWSAWGAGTGCAICSVRRGLISA